MQFFTNTLRFDDDSHSLTAENGIPADDLAELVKDLLKALHLPKTEKVVISEIRGNCYAVDLATTSFLASQNIQNIHAKISDNDFKGLTTVEIAYAKTLKRVLSPGIYLQVYNEQTKTQKIEVKEIRLPKIPQFYFEHSSMDGVLTAIGGKNLDGKSVIRLTDAPYSITINAGQEKELIKYYKKNTLRLIVKKKLRFDDDQIIEATLEDFEYLENNFLINQLSSFKEQYPDDIFSFE